MRKKMAPVNSIARRLAVKGQVTSPVSHTLVGMIGSLRNIKQALTTFTIDMKIKWYELIPVSKGSVYLCLLILGRLSNLSHTRAR